MTNSLTPAPTMSAPVLARGALVTVWDRPAVITQGNEPDVWGAPRTVSVMFTDKSRATRYADVHPDCVTAATN